MEKQKLKVMDYIFCYQGKDLTNAFVEYEFGFSEVTEFKDGKKSKTYKIPYIDCEISATDGTEEFSISFMLRMGLEDLLNLPEEIINVNDKVIEGEMFFFDPYDKSKKSRWLDPHLKPTMYHPLAEFCTQKVKENKIQLKVSLPEDDIFLLFALELNTK